MRHDSDPMASAPKSFVKQAKDGDDSERDSFEEDEEETNAGRDEKRNVEPPRPRSPPPMVELNLQGNSVVKVGPSICDPTLLVTILPKEGVKIELEHGTAIGSAVTSNTSTFVGEMPAVLPGKSCKQVPAVKPQSLEETGSEQNQQVDTDEEDEAEDLTKELYPFLDVGIRKCSCESMEKLRSADKKSVSKERLKSPARNASELPRRKTSKTKSAENCTKSGKKTTLDKRRTKSKDVRSKVSNQKKKPKSSETGGNSKERMKKKTSRTKSTGSNSRVAIRKSASKLKTKTTSRSQGKVTVTRSKSNQNKSIGGKDSGGKTKRKGGTTGKSKTKG